MRASTITIAALAALSGASASKCRPGTSSLVIPTTLQTITTSAATVPALPTTTTTSADPITATSSEQPTTTTTTAPAPTCALPDAISSFPTSCTNGQYRLATQPTYYWQEYCSRSSPSGGVSISQSSSYSMAQCVNACVANPACVAAARIAPANLCILYGVAPTAYGGSGVYDVAIRYDAPAECVAPATTTAMQTPE